MPNSTGDMGPSGVMGMPTLVILEMASTSSGRDCLADPAPRVTERIESVSAFWSSGPHGLEPHSPHRCSCFARYA